jgi:hypothetical protein
MSSLVIKVEIQQKLLRIANDEGFFDRLRTRFWSTSRRCIEVASTIEHLDLLEATVPTNFAFWNVRWSASGLLESKAQLKSGKPIWRLCPSHVYCIALLAEQDDDLLVLDICNRAALRTVESRLATQ